MTPVARKKQNTTGLLNQKDTERRESEDDGTSANRKESDDDGTSANRRESEDDGAAGNNTEEG